MSSSNGSNANNNPAANGPSVVVPKPNPSLFDQALKLVRDAVYYVIRLYCLILLVIYFWVAKVFARALQPLEPFLEQMHKIPQNEVTVDGIRSQIFRLIATVLLLVSPLVHRVIGYVTRPLIWSRDKLVEFADQEESPRQTDPKES